MREQTTQGFLQGVQNKIPADTIAPAAAQDSLSWNTIDGHIELSRGRIAIGAEGVLGAIYAEFFAPKKDGTKVHFRKTGTKIQYFDGSAWQDSVTGLSVEDYTFCSYISLAGAYMYAGGPDGIYKIATANPASAKNMFLDGTNHKGKILINDQRMFLWDRRDGTIDKTALYLSKIDPQTTNYTTVTNEVIATGDGATTNFSGTLAQATGTRFVFGISINTNPASVTATDNYTGTISGTGVTGTINYATGAWTLVFSVAPAAATQIRATYLYEDSNNGGITDFRFTSPVRVAGEGDIIPQEFLGEPIQNVLVFEGKYYSMKKTCAYELNLTIDDTNATNIVYRQDIGVPSLRGCVSTGSGIVFLNTANASRPQLTLLQRNPVGGTLEPINLTPLFAWENYDSVDCTIDTWDSKIILFARQIGTPYNDRMFVINPNQKYSVDIYYYSARTVGKDGTGNLFIGDSLTESVYQIFSGFDDLADTIANYWTGKAEPFASENLKRTRYIRFRGLIQPDQYYQVYEAYDGGDYTLIGTVRGDQSYVDFTSSQAIGENGIGTQSIGGGNPSAVGYPYFMEMRIRTPKFRTRTLQIIALGIGYVSIEYICDMDIELFEQKIPRRFRQKQHVSLDGTQTDLPTFP